MNTLVKAGMGFGAVAGASGTGYGIYIATQPASKKTKTYAEELEGTLLSTNGKEEQDKWTLRLASLKQAKTDAELVSSLLTIKQKQPNPEWTELRHWCKDIIVKKNKGKEDKEFKNIQSYCTFSIKEKLPNAILQKNSGNDNEWAVGYAALKNIDENKLDTKLKEAKKEAMADQQNKAVKDWCNGVFDKPYKGIKDQEFENASKVCVTG